MKHLLTVILRTRHWLAVALSLVALPPAFSQTPASKPVGPSATIQSLRLIPLAGEGEINDLERRVMAPLVVQVLDQNGRPVEAAEVVFRFPLREPSAVFPNEQSSRTVKTNAEGQVAAEGWAARGTGRFQVRVTAIRGEETGELLISMTNAVSLADELRKQTKSWWSSKWVKIAVIAGAAGAVTGIVLATRGSDTPTVGATPGVPTIGGP